MFCIRCANVGRAHRVKIQREPIALDNVLVRSGAFDAVLEPIRRAGEEGRGTGIQPGIDCWGPPTPLLRRLYEDLRIIKIS
jgi:hypothetical protein